MKTPLYTQNNTNDHKANECDGDSVKSSENLLEVITSLWLDITSYLESTVSGFKLDVRLAAYSLYGLLFTIIFITALLICLLFTCMALLFVALVSLHVPVMTALFIMTMIIFSLLIICYGLFRRYLSNLKFRATHSALSPKPEHQDTQ